MCRYRKSIFLCNHTQLQAAPFLLCGAQQEHLAGAASEPCGVVDSHRCTTIRVARLCASCEAKKAAQDKTFAKLRERLAELRQHMDESYGDCMKHVDEAGLKPPVEKKPPVEEKEEAGPKEEMDDPVVAFLKKKKGEKYSHLMMLGSS